MLQTVERNWDNRQNEQFEFSDIDSGWEVSDLSETSSAKESPVNNQSIGLYMNWAKKEKSHTFCLKF